MKRVLILLSLGIISLTGCGNNTDTTVGDNDDIVTETVVETIGDSSTSTLSEDEFAEELIEFFNEMDETTDEETN
jgi:uncharacterized protein YcfL